MKYMGTRPDYPTPAFWRMVDMARERPDALGQAVAGLDRRELVELHSAYRDAAELLLEPDYLEHASQDLSEDGIDELVTWIVAQGEAYYRKVLAEPSSMPERAGDWDDLQSALVKEYDQRYGRALPWIEDLPDEGGDASSAH